MEQKEATIINITDNAAEKVKTLMAQEGEEDLALRIGVRPGGCSGFQYSIYFDDEIADDDEVFETKGVSARRRDERPLHHGLGVRLRRRPHGRRFRCQQPQRPGRLRLRQLFHLLDRKHTEKQGARSTSFRAFSCLRPQPLQGEHDGRNPTRTDYLSRADEDEKLFHGHSPPPARARRG